ncbi:MAG: DUF11 domain-containing protein, partial [Sulfurovum sp.]|nr:DUF11 domain-containing protein [Sulfurovum sp.]
MNFAHFLLKILTIFAVTILFTTNTYAVDIVLDNTITEISGDGDITTCETGDVYRLGSSTTYNGRSLDLLVEITAEDNEYDQISNQNAGSCISVSNGILHTRLRDRDSGENRAFMDLNISVVLQGTTTLVEVDRIVFSAMDLDKVGAHNPELATDTDNVYIKDPTKAYIQSDGNSDVTYNEGDFGDGFNIELKGRDLGALSNCTDEINNPQSECRAGGIAIYGLNGPNMVSSIDIRVANDNAYGMTDSTRAYRLIQLSFQESDFEAILVDHRDHGDMPASYGDAMNESTVFTVLGYGFPADSEVVQHSTLADLDDGLDVGNINFDDEDGVRLGSQLISGTEFNMTVGYKYDLNVTTIGNGYLSVWIDLDGDGIFSGGNEQLLVDYTISSTVAINTIIPLALPTTNYSGRSYIRFRFSESAGVESNGDGGKGEVEDYTVFFNPSGSVSGHIYNDFNGNGTQDTGEPDLPDVNVTVTAANGETQTVTTDTNGDYTIEYVAAGEASVDIDNGTLPAGAIQTEGSDPTPVMIYSDANSFEENNGFQMQANLVTEKTVDNSTPQEGDSVTFTITVKNHGASHATTVSLTDTLPAGITY